MFNSSPSIAKMQPGDITQAVKIIKEHDEDDAEYAQETYAKSLENQYVYVKGKTVLGVTGFKLEGDIANLSWTYLSQKHRKQGHGTEMLNAVIEIMKTQGVRKVYVETSDYRESSGAPMLYEDAIRLYQKNGFQQEAYHPHYYEPNEGLLIYGLRLEESRQTRQHIPRENADGIELEQPFFIDETESSYALDWYESGTAPLTTAVLQAAVKFAQIQGAKSVFISFPSTFIPAIASILSESHFIEEAQLIDYYADGINEVRYRLNKP